MLLANQLFVSSMKYPTFYTSAADNTVFFCTQSSIVQANCIAASKGILNICYDTCLALGLIRLVEQIIIQFRNMKSLISNTEKVFCKAPLRTVAFRQKIPATPLSPQPVLT
jgi:hypothetical protein